MDYAHIAILTRKLESSIKWYEKVFQFKAKQITDTGSMRYVFLYHEKYPAIEIELIEENTDSKNTNGVIDHFALILDDLDVFMGKFPHPFINYQSPTPIITATGIKTIFIFGPNMEKIQLIERKV